MMKKRGIKFVALLLMATQVITLMSGCSSADKSKYIHNALPGLNESMINEINLANKNMNILKDAVSGNSDDVAEAEQQAKQVKDILSKYTKDYIDVNADDSYNAVSGMLDNLSYVATNFECATYLARQVAEGLSSGSDASFAAGSGGASINEKGFNKISIKNPLGDGYVDAYYTTYGTSCVGGDNNPLNFIGSGAEVSADVPIVSYVFGKRMSAEVFLADLSVNKETDNSQIYDTDTRYVRGTDYTFSHSGIGAVGGIDYNSNTAVNNPLHYGKKATEVTSGTMESEQYDFTDQNYYCNSIKSILKSGVIGLKNKTDGGRVLSRIDDKGRLQQSKDKTPIKSLKNSYLGWLCSLEEVYGTPDWDDQTERNTLSGLRNAATAIAKESKDFCEGGTAFDFQYGANLVVNAEGKKITSVNLSKLTAGASKKATERFAYDEGLTNAGYNSDSYDYISFVRAGVNQKFNTDENHNTTKVLVIRIKMYDLTLPDGVEKKDLISLEVASSAKPIEAVSESANDIIRSMLGGDIFALDYNKVGTTSVGTLLTKIGTGVTVGTYSSYFSKVGKLSSGKAIVNGGTEFNVANTKDFVTVKDVPMKVKPFTGMTAQPVAIARVQTFDSDAFKELVSTMDGGTSRFIYAVGGTTTTGSGGGALASGNSCYLVQYPVLAITEFTPDYANKKWYAISASTVNKDSTSGSYIQSDTASNNTNLELNFLGDNLYQRDNKDKQYDKFNNKNLYFFSEDNCSFAFAKVKAGIAFKDMFKVDTTSYSLHGLPTIILTDYLEGVYLPGVGDNASDKFTCFGRRIRVTEQTGTLKESEVIGYYLDKSGNKMTEIAKVNLGNIISANTDTSLKVSGDTVGAFNRYVEKLYAGMYGGSTTDFKITDSSSIFGTIKEMRESMPANSLEKTKVKIQTNPDSGYKYSKSTLSGAGDDSGMLQDSTSLSAIKAGTVYTGRFADGALSDTTASSEEICTAASVDIGNTQVKSAKLFTLCTDNSLTESDLFNGWINGKDDTSGNLEWWNGWLDKNFYKYKIDLDAIQGQLDIYYRFDRAKDGYIILDLNTVGLIQEKMDKDALQEESNLFRTMARVIGILMIFYGLLLLVGWTVDINIEGIGMLTRLTFGNRVAVQDATNLPEESNVKFATFYNVLKMAIIISAIGLVISTTDIVSVVGRIVDSFGAIINAIRNGIFGD